MSGPHSLKIAAGICLLWFVPVALVSGQDTPPAPPVPEGPPVHIELSSSEVVLEEGASAGKFESSEPVRIQVGSWLPLWRILCVAEAAAGPDGAQILPNEFFIRLANSPDNPQNGYVGPPLNLAHPIMIAEGRPTDRRMIEVNTLHLNVQVDPHKPPGRYHGKLRFLAEDETVGMVSFSLSIPEYINFSMDPEGMRFGSLTPGVREAVKPIPVQVETNCRIEINLEIPDLRREDGKRRIPRSNICLGGGTTPQEAQRDAREKTFGESRFTCTCGPGIHTIYLFCRLNLTISIPAGTFDGVINVTYNKTP